MACWGPGGPGREGSLSCWSGSARPRIDAASWRNEAPPYVMVGPFSVGRHRCRRGGLTSSPSLCKGELTAAVGDSRPGGARRGPGCSGRDESARDGCAGGVGDGRGGRWQRGLSCRTGTRRRPWRCSRWAGDGAASWWPLRARGRRDRWGNRHQRGTGDGRAATRAARSPPGGPARNSRAGKRGTDLGVISRVAASWPGDFPLVAHHCDQLCAFR